MVNHLLRDKVIEEVDLIPLEKLIEIYDIIHFFRIGLDKSRTNKDEVLAFAGCWKDMSDEEFNSFTEETRHRRKGAF